MLRFPAVDPSARHGDEGCPWMRPPRLAALDHHLFQVVLAALAEPGTLQVAPGELAGGDLVQAIAAAIWEETTPTWTAPGLVPLPGTPVGAADASVLYTTGDDAARLGIALQGSAASPELGATVLLQPAPTTTPVVLDGPGIPTLARRVLPMTPAAIAARNARCASAPLGIDLVIIDGHVVTGLPRTTTIRPLA